MTLITDRPGLVGGGGVRGDSHIIGTGMLVGKVELRPLRRRYFNKVWWRLAFLRYNFFNAQPQERENELIYALDDTCMGKNINFASWPP